ncbi:hypothetical protein [Pseudidiomarina homiensis]|uniref:hypothetical protein n=1 Tax=Pseudidiomarina homiensis TaxID=364198 RepID=UPI00215AE793|nr:hypothetical protein [Pseudidiomarina homiensis]
MNLTSRLQNIDKRALGVAGALALLCLFDFSQRVWIASADNDSIARDLASAGQIQVATPRVVDELQAWFAEREQVRKQIEQASSSDKDDAEQALLPGGVDVGPLRIRLRAILISTENAQKVAIMEAQNNDDRSVELIERTVGEALGEYNVSAVRVNEIVFQRADETIVVPIFDDQHNAEE